jgi:hypothetical protein
MIFVLAVICSITSASQISCERDSTNRVARVGASKFCFMQTSTTIATEGVLISLRDPYITELNFNLNHKISFLPVRVHKAFPSLINYMAAGCSLKSIGRESFKNLNNLRVLLLQSNQITTIYNDTFTDLLSLEYLDLGKKINF